MNKLHSVSTTTGIGVMAGAIFYFTFDGLLNIILKGAIEDGVHFVLALLLVAAYIYIVLLVALIVATIVSYLALKFFGVPKAALTVSIAAAVISLISATVINQGIAPTSQPFWLCLFMFSAVYGLVSFALTFRRSKP